MSTQDLLQKASFRGAEFFVDSASTTGGRKTVTHEFPNTDRRYIQDMGLKQRSFTVDAIITGSGADYFSKRDALLNALETAGAGILVHPFYGQVSVVNDPYTLVEEISSIGRARISVIFHRADPNIFPESTGSNLSTVVNKAQAGISTSETATAKKFTAPKLASNIAHAAAKLNDFSNKVKSAAEKINQYSSSLAVIGTSIQKFKDDISSMMQTPAIMAANISAAFNSLLGIASTPKEALVVVQTLFSFGSTDAPVLPTTASLVERQANADALNNAVNVAALATAYSIVPTLTFNTLDDINDVNAILEAQYKALPNTLDTDVYLAMEALRNEVRTFLDNAALTAWKIASIKSPEIPATVLSFMYYGNLTAADLLIALNATPEPSFLNGNTEILTR